MLAIVLSLLALMAVTLTVIFLSNRMALRRESEERLRTYAERYSLEEPSPDLPPVNDLPPDKKGPGKNEEAFRLSTFYSVAYGPDGEVLAVRNDNQAMQSRESLIALADRIRQSGKTSGALGSVLFLTQDRGAYQLVAMIDRTMMDHDQQTLIRQMLLFGSLALAVLCAASVFLARWIVRPLEENDRRQKRFVSDAGHELKTPIAVISANSELLRRQVGENEWLANIDYENERMSDLVQQLLTLSRAESGGLPRQALDFSQLVGGEVLPFESYAFEKERQIVSDIAPGLTVEGTPGQLKQMVSILLDNAVSHSTQGPILLTLRREKNAAVLRVSNRANEMSAGQLSHLFERFYRTDEARGGEDAHYGLGLPIAKAVAEAHGGEIRAAWRNGEAVFTVSLPLQKTGG